MANQYQDLANKLFRKKEEAPLDSGNKYSDIARESLAPSESNFKRSQFVAKDKSPEVSLETMRISKETNLPASFVERNIESLKKKRVGADTSYSSIVARSPPLDRDWETNCDLLK